jgi:hypothetical protein
MSDCIYDITRGEGVGFMFCLGGMLHKTLTFTLQADNGRQLLWRWLRAQPD